MKFYDFTAPFYNFFLDPFFHQGRKEVAKQINKSNPNSILDLGCGTGKITSFLESSISYTGIDISLKSIQIARKNSKSLHFKFKHVGIEKFSSNNKYDIILINHILSVVENPEEILNKAYLNCAKSGRVFIINHFSDTPEYFNKASKLIGFKTSFPFRPKLFEDKFKIKSIDSVNLLGKWKLIELEPKH